MDGVLVPLIAVDIVETDDMVEDIDSAESFLDNCPDGLLGGKAGEDCEDCFLGGSDGAAGFAGVTFF